MNVSDYDFHLPEELIAAFPPEKRDGARMMVVSRENGVAVPKMFTDFTDYLQAGDCLVLNNTKVISARLFGKRRGFTGKIEILLLEPVSTHQIWRCFIKPGRRMQIGTIVDIDNGNGDFATVTNKRDDGTYVIEFSSQNPDELFEKAGHMPLPPYIKRDDTPSDKERYQTVFAKNLGAVAAPTAGLHFTPKILEELKNKGVTIAHVTLHVGAGTFQPIKADKIEDHIMHEEWYELSEESANIINKTKKNNGRIAAIGTTAVRVLETCANDNNAVCAGTGKTSIFLYPPQKPKITDILLTNFHLPKSTLIMLVSCFSSREDIMQAYQLAINEKFRFFSFGDCMLLI